jgi:hypothetical protein
MGCDTKSFKSRALADSDHFTSFEYEPASEQEMEIKTVQNFEEVIPDMQRKRFSFLRQSKKDQRYRTAKRKALFVNTQLWSTREDCRSQDWK